MKLYNKHVFFVVFDVYGQYLTASGLEPRTT